MSVALFRLVSMQPQTWMSHHTQETREKDAQLAEAQRTIDILREILQDEQGGSGVRDPSRQWCQPITSFT